ncbi:MAG: DUF805 domain-containing protein [Pseudomonadota bacterium]
MGFMEAVQTCLNKYATISGRARRAEYWWWTLFAILGSFVLTVVEMGIGLVGILSGIFSLAILIPSICVTVRRLHDLDRTGWWCLILLVPLIGAIVILVFAITRGTEGDNRFGPDPLAGEY